MRKFLLALAVILPMSALAAIHGPLEFNVNNPSSDQLCGWDNSALDSACFTLSDGLTTTGTVLSVNLGDFDTDDLAQGGTNLYYTDEYAREGVGAIFDSTLYYDSGAVLMGINLNNANVWTASQEFSQINYAGGGTFVDSDGNGYYITGNPMFDNTERLFGDGTNLYNINHSTLNNLSIDTHTQYALLAGRAGGQTLFGGNAANDDITIHGTSNATRTSSYVLLQPTAGNVAIGASSTSNKLGVVGTAQSPTNSTLLNAAQLGVYNNGVSRIGIVGSTQADFFLDDTGSSADQKQSQFLNDAGYTSIRSITDAGGIGKWLFSGNHSTGYVGLGAGTATLAALEITNTGPNWTTAGATSTIQMPNAGSIKWAANSGGYRWGVSQFNGGLFLQQNSADSSATPLYRQIWRDAGNFEYYGTGAAWSAADLSFFASLMNVNGRGASTSSPFIFLTHMDDDDNAKNMGIAGRVRANGKYISFGQTMGQRDNSFGTATEGIQRYYGIQFNGRTFSTAEAPTVLKGWEWAYWNGSAYANVLALNILAGSPGATITKAGEQLRLAYDTNNFFAMTTDSAANATLNLTASAGTPEFTFSDAINVPDDAYAVGWNGNTEAPTKNAIYDKTELLTTGAASSTDNAVARFDGTTGKIIQNSGVIIDDSNGLSASNVTDAALTSGRVVIASTAGLLADDADMTFATDTFTVTKITSSAEAHPIPAAKTADYPTTASDYTILVNPNGANRTVTLHTNGADGQELFIKKITDVSGYQVTISGTIDGAANFILNNLNEGVKLQWKSSTSTWYVVGYYPG